jgi:NADH-quinone oxidoreductase subunit G
MRDYADVLLPINCFSETSGTFVNCEGRWQSFSAASRAPGASRPGWKVLRVLGNLLELEGFDETSSEQVRDALSRQLGEVSVDNSQCGESVGGVSPGSGLQRIAYLPLYAVDAIVRRAQALQNTPDGDVSALCLNSADATGLGLANGDKVLVSEKSGSAPMKVIVSDAVAEGAALLSMAIEATLPLGAPGGTLTVTKV